MLTLFCIFVIALFSTKTDAVGTGTVRLYRNGVPDTTQSWSSGIVQIYYNNEWGNICDDNSFGSDEADVICHQLSYTGASSYSNTLVTSTWGIDTSDTVIDDVACSGSFVPLTITQCTYSTSFTSFECNDATDVIVNCYSTRIWDSPSPGDIRLTGGTYSNQGLLEVYCNGEWGTVCDDDFYSTHARIACKQLGYNAYESFDHLTMRGDSSQNIWLHVVDECTISGDMCLTSCGRCHSASISFCQHYEDITLSCDHNPVDNPVQVFNSSGACANINHPDSANNGTVRLYRNGVGDTSQSWSSGIVQIYYNDQWGNICYYYEFGVDEADVICHQLGYTGASSYSNTGVTTIWGIDTSPTLLSQVFCSLSTYLTVTQCSFATFSSTGCNDNYDVTVSCYSTRIWDSPSPGDIRLTGGKYSSEGLLEVYCNGQWGTVCDDNFDTGEARVACRQLGYNYYESYDPDELQGISSQPIWLWQLYECFSDSSYTCLTNCGGCPSRGVTGCVHSEDVNLICKYSSSYPKITSETSKNCNIRETPTGGGDGGTIYFSSGSVGIVISIAVCLIVICAACFTKRRHRDASATARAYAAATQVLRQWQPQTTADTVTPNDTETNINADTQPLNTHEGGSDDTTPTYRAEPPPYYIASNPSYNLHPPGTSQHATSQPIDIPSRGPYYHTPIPPPTQSNGDERPPPPPYGADEV